MVPLSVVLFTIAFDELNKIILKHKNIQLSLYADDAIVYKKIKNLNTIEQVFKIVLKDIKDWGNMSGASLEISKCKTLHICRKRNCVPPNITFNNNPINDVESLKI